MPASSKAFTRHFQCSVTATDIVHKDQIMPALRHALLIDPEGISKKAELLLLGIDTLHLVAIAPLLEEAIQYLEALDPRQVQGNFRHGLPVTFHGWWHWHDVGSIITEPGKDRSCQLLRNRQSCLSFPIILQAIDQITSLGTTFSQKFLP